MNLCYALCAAFLGWASLMPASAGSVNAAHLVEGSGRSVYDAILILQNQVKRHPIVLRLRADADAAASVGGDSEGWVHARVLKSYKGEVEAGDIIAYVPVPQRYVGQTYTGEAYVMAREARFHSNGVYELRDCVVVPFHHIRGDMVRAFMCNALIWSGFTTQDEENALNQP